LTLTVVAKRRPDSFSRPFVAHLYTHLLKPYRNRGFRWLYQPDATIKSRGSEGVAKLVYKGEALAGRVCHDRKSGPKRFHGVNPCAAEGYVPKNIKSLDRSAGRMYRLYQEIAKYVAAYLA